MRKTAMHLIRNVRLFSIKNFTEINLQKRRLALSVWR